MVRIQHSHGPRRRTTDIPYVATAASAAVMLGLADYRLGEPSSIEFLYALPVALVAFRFHYVGCALASLVVAALVAPFLSLRAGSAYFDVSILSLAFVVVTGLLMAKIGRDLAENSVAVDEVSGLASRHAVIGALSLELTRAARYGRPLSVLVVRLGSNDVSVSGPRSRSLAEVGQEIERRLRDVDVVGRYSDSEFLVVLPETPKSAAREVAERMRLVVQESVRSLPALRRDLTEPDVDIGVAGYPEDSRTVEGLIDAAEYARVA